MTNIKIRQINSKDSLYPYNEKILSNSFPEEEFRELDLQRELTDVEKEFHNSVIELENQPIGILAYWTFKDFTYIEHFAIDEKFRGKGYGKKVIRQFTSAENLPIVLEVEIPDNTIAKKRVHFYEEAGYHLWHNKYNQPPYRTSDDPLPMNIMVHGCLFSSLDFEGIKEKLYREVYKVN